MGITRSASTASAYKNDSINTPGLTEEDETAPATRSSSVVKRGWGAATKKMEETASSSYAEDWTPPVGETLIKFMEDDPFATVGQHWVKEITDGKRSFNCPEEDCPLCEVGHGPRALVYFNIVPINVNGTMQEPKVVALKAGPLLTGKIKEEHDGRGGPISRHFWILKRTETQQGRSKKTDYSLQLVKARDLADDFEMDPEAIAESLKSLESKVYDESIIKVDSVETLEQVVREHLSND